MKTLSLIALLIAQASVGLLATSFASQLEQRSLSAKEITATIDQVSLVLDDYYVYPDVAKEMAIFLRKRNSDGDYQRSQTQGELIVKVQSDLRAVSRDLHISLRMAADSIDRASHILPKTKTQQTVDARFISQKGYTKKVGYLRVNKFSSDLQTKNLLIDAMKKLATSDALIIDLRENLGGDPNLVALLSSYFLEDDTHLWSVFDRDAKQVFEARSIGNSEKFIGDLCVLISNKTYSAPEAFAYTLKHLDRACIVGEASGGGAHLVEMRRVNNEIDIRIPVARAYNSITQSNWEGRGVIPTIDVPASKAKEAAIEFLNQK